MTKYSYINLFVTIILCIAVLTCICFFNGCEKKDKKTDNSTTDFIDTTIDLNTTNNPIESNREVPDSDNEIEETTGDVVDTTVGTPDSTKGPEDNEPKAPTQETTNIPETTKTPANTEAPHSHYYYKRVTRPTCTTDGYTLNICDCGDSYKSDATTKLGHRYTTWYVKKEATTSETGIKESRCDICGSEPITEVIPKKTVESFVDSRISVRKSFGKLVYEYGTCTVYERRTWGNVLSISILDDGGFHITYDNKNGEMIEFEIHPLANYESCANILEDGTYTTSYIGAFS